MLKDNGEECVRLRGSQGNYLSLLPCACDAEGNVTCVDICLPSGKVLYCGVPLALVEIFCAELGVETI